MLTSGFTIGPFYLPADIAMLIVACVEGSAKGVKHTPLLTAEKHEATGLKNSLLARRLSAARVAAAGSFRQPLNQ